LIKKAINPLEDPEMAIEDGFTKAGAGSVVA
jgi:hypothetical protein